MKKNPLEIDMIAGSQLRDSQGETLSVEGADITPLLDGSGRLNDNHGKGFYNSIGRVTGAKKIFSEADCEDDRQRYYWEKVKSPYIYVKGVLYDNEEHPNAKAAAAILRNIHKSDCPLQIKASVEGGVISRGIKDPTLLARTKIHSVALTFTPANHGTLVEPVSLEKSAMTAEDEALIKSVIPFAKSDVPSFRHVTRHLSAEKISSNVEKMKELSDKLGLKTKFNEVNSDKLIKDALSQKITENVARINELVKTLKAADKKKVKSTEEQLLKASKEQVYAMMGSEGQAKEAADWARKTLKRDDLVLWFARNYKKNPSIYNDENKTTLEHFSGMDHIPEVKNIRLTKDHDFNAGIEAFKQAEDVAKKKAADKTSLVEPDGEKILDAGDGYAWYSLGKGSCPEEAKAMGHCGNGPSVTKGDNILSLRKEYKVGDKTFHEPHLTFIENDGHLGEMKGKGNAKPAQKYHGAIKKLLESDHVEKIVGGGYEAKNNFRLADLPEKDRKELLTKKPNLDPFATMSKVDPDTFPEKHDEDVEFHNKSVDIMNSAFKKYGDLDTIFKSSGDELADDAQIEALNHSAFLDHIKPHHIDQALSNPDEYVRMAATRSPHVSEEHLNRALHDEDYAVREKAVYNPRFTANNFNKVFNDKEQPPSLRALATKTPHFKEEHFDKAFNDDAEEVRAAAVQSPHFKQEHAHQAANDKSNMVFDSFIDTPYFGQQHIKRGLQSERGLEVLESSHFEPEHMNMALSHDNLEETRIAAVRTEYFKPEHMAQALNDPSDLVRIEAIGSPHFKEEHFDKAFNDSDANVRATALKTKYSKPQHVEQALNDKDLRFRIAAVQSPQFGPEHMDKALGDPAAEVRLKAIKSKHFGPEHVERALHDPSSNENMFAALYSKHFGPQHIDAALNSKNPHLRAEAVKSKHFGPQHMERALNNNSEWVREAAMKSPHFKPELHNKLIRKSINQSGEDMLDSISKKIAEINHLAKMLTAGYGGASAPTSRVGGAVIQSEAIDRKSDKSRYILCSDCGDEQVYVKHQCKCRNCNKNFPLSVLSKFMASAD